MDVITKKADARLPRAGHEDLLLGGGVAANSRLRELLAARCASEGVRLIIPKFTLCTDNGRDGCGAGCPPGRCRS